MNRYITDRALLEELISVTAEQLGLSEPYVVEKDLYVTLAIEVLTKVENPHFKLIFQGGTCLAKAYHLVQRMSEDCDFRIVHHDLRQYSHETQCRYLRYYRKQLIDTLQEHNFIIDADTTEVRNEGQFIGISATYPSIFPVAQALKPHLALEFFLSDLKSPSHSKTVTTLIRRTLGDKVQHPEFPVEAMSIVETAAEKWVALTRRIATMEHNHTYYDQSLVRHLYDLHKINEHGFLNDQFSQLVAEIIQQDRKQFKSQSLQYYQNPEGEIRLALDILQTDPKWQQYWDEFMQTMVFDSHKLKYQNALKNFLTLSDEVLLKTLLH